MRRLLAGPAPFLVSTTALAAGAGHDAAPSGPIEYLLVAVGGLVVAVVIVQALRYLVRPRESGADHIKRRVLRDGR